MGKIDKEQLKQLLREILPELMAEGVVKIIKGGKHTYYLMNDMLHLAASTPKVKLEGSEASAMNLSLRENAGYIEIYDEAAATTRTKWSGSTGRRTTPLITTDELATNTIKIKVPIPIPDSPQTGLAADSTGVKFTSVYKLKILKQNLKDVIVRATWTASATDSVTAIELYDPTTAAVVASISGNTGTDVDSTNYTAANLTDDGLVYIRVNVTTASATTGATTDVTYAVVELVYGAG